MIVFCFGMMSCLTEQWFIEPLVTDLESGPWGRRVFQQARIRQFHVEIAIGTWRCCGLSASLKPTHNRDSRELQRKHGNVIDKLSGLIKTNVQSMASFLATNYLQGKTRTFSEGVCFQRQLECWVIARMTQRYWMSGMLSAHLCLFEARRCCGLPGLDPSCSTFL